MRKAFLFIFILLLQLLVPASASLKNLAFGWHNEKVSFEASSDLSGIRTSQPVYVRLQALQEGSVVFWESIPQSFQDHVATINVSVLAVMVSSNALSIDLYNDEMGNIWLAVNYTFNKGDYISTLTWVSSETVSENLTIPETVSFPEIYPDNVKPFLNSGRKMPVDNIAIKEIAETYRAPDNMIETVENILSFVNETQTYDSEKVKLLMSGVLNTTNILDFLNDPLESLETGNSFCFERALLAATILRAAKVPARTFTNADLKTWIQVWLPETGWVDAEVLCVQPVRLFPRPLSFAVPWMTENSSDAIFPFTWLPEVSMRVANLTFSHMEAFNINEYGTVLSEPVDVNIYEADPDKFSFQVIFEPETVQAALTQNGSDLTFHFNKSDDKTTSKTLILGETNNIEFEGLSVSFKPVRQGDIIILHNFTVQELWMFDVRILIPFVAAVPAVLIFWWYLKRKRIKP